MGDKETPPPEAPCLALAWLTLTSGCPFFLSILAPATVCWLCLCRHLPSLWPASPPIHFLFVQSTPPPPQD